MLSIIFCQVKKWMEAQNQWQTVREVPRTHGMIFLYRVFAWVLELKIIGQKAYQHICLFIKLLESRAYKTNKYRSRQKRDFVATTNPNILLHSETCLHTIECVAGSDPGKPGLCKKRDVITGDDNEVRLELPNLVLCWKQFIDN